MFTSEKAQSPRPCTCGCTSVSGLWYLPGLSVPWALGCLAGRQSVPAGVRQALWTFLGCTHPCGGCFPLLARELLCNAWLEPVVPLVCPPGFEAACGYRRAYRGADGGESGASRSQAVWNRGQNLECLSSVRAFWFLEVPVSKAGTAAMVSALGKVLIANTGQCVCCLVPGVAK